MKLTDSQIQELYTFTKKHYVEWYDVQTELVDHLANGVEAQWQKKPKLSFEEALKWEFKKFGVCGFSDVVGEKTNALNKQYWVLIWRYFKAYFNLPKLIVTVFLMWAYFQVLVFSMAYTINWVMIPTLTLLFGLPWYMFIKSFKIIKRQKKKTGKKWLFEQTLSQFGGLVHCMNIALYLQIIFQNQASWEFWPSLFFSIFAISFSILLFVAIFIVTPKLRKQMEMLYPDYKIV